VLSKKTSYLLLLAGLMLGSVASAQQESAAWNGQWLAEGTLFRIEVTVDAELIEIAEVESLGFVWSSQSGEIDGNVANIPVSYGGVSGIIQAQLIDASTAVAFAASCEPEFMVVCVLAKDRQAIFRKVNESLAD